MNSVQEVFQITEKLMLLVENPPSKGDRDEVIDTITSLLDLREDLLLRLKSPFTHEEEQQVKQIMIWNEKITQQFTELKLQVQQDLTQLKNTKSSTNKYVNPYQNTSIDGMFYDKRK